MTNRRSSSAARLQLSLAASSIAGPISHSYLLNKWDFRDIETRQDFIESGAANAGVYAAPVIPKFEVMFQINNLRLNINEEKCNNNSPSTAFEFTSQCLTLFLVMCVFPVATSVEIWHCLHVTDKIAWRPNFLSFVTFSNESIPLHLQHRRFLPSSFTSTMRRPIHRLESDLALCFSILFCWIHSHDTF